MLNGYTEGDGRVPGAYIGDAIGLVVIKEQLADAAKREIVAV